MKDRHCKHLGECGSCVLDIAYEEQINLKLNFIKDKFSEFYGGEFEVFTSKTKGYRIRAEFGLYHENDDLFYTMNGLNEKYLKIDECPKVDVKIATLMPNLLNVLKSDAKLKFKAFRAEFIATRKSILAILLYHRDIYEIKDDLEKLAKNLGINLIARSRGKKLVFGDETLCETLYVNERKFKYSFESEAFIQPNRSVNEQMIGWILANVNEPKDLLEMYCGHGNFSIPLSFKFRRVLANEISKNSIKNAKINALQNNALNLDFLRMSSEELMSAFKGTKFNRLNGIDLGEFKFSHILVDPPRAGLDESVINFIKNYENIIYISCNPDTLYQNLSEISKTHEVIKFAIFDQFVHTKHIECGVILRKI